MFLRKFFVSGLLIIPALSVSSVNEIVPLIVDTAARAACGTSLERAAAHMGSFAPEAVELAKFFNGKSLDDQIVELYGLKTWDPEKKPDWNGFCSGMHLFETSEGKAVIKRFLEAIDLGRESCFNFFSRHSKISEEGFFHVTDTELKREIVVGGKKAIVTISSQVSDAEVYLASKSKGEGDRPNLENLQIFFNSSASEALVADDQISKGTESSVAVKQGGFEQIWSFFSDMFNLRLISAFKRVGPTPEEAGHSILEKARAAWGRFLRNPDLRGAKVTRLHVVHTHPHDPIRMTFPDGKEDLIYPNLSRPDARTLLHLQTELRIPVTVTAIVGVSRDTLSRMSIELVPEPSGH